MRSNEDVENTNVFEELTDLSGESFEIFSEDLQYKKQENYLYCIPGYYQIW
jgi:hypothetical protein